MCLSVYIASDAPLPERKWNEDAPDLYLEPVSESEGVCRQFRYRHVYYAVSHEGCGCGFSKDGRDSEELQRCQDNYRSLAGVVSSALHNGAGVPLFTCWEGEQTAKRETDGVVTVAQLLGARFELQQLSLLTIDCGE